MGRGCSPYTFTVLREAQWLIEMQAEELQQLRATLREYANANEAVSKAELARSNDCRENERCIFAGN